MVKGAVVNNSRHSGIISKEENKAAGYLNTHTSLSENSEVINSTAQKAEARRIRVPGQPGDKSKKLPGKLDVVPHVLALETLRQVDCHEFKVSLGYRVRHTHSYERREGGRRERLRLATTLSGVIQNTWSSWDCA